MPKDMSETLDGKGVTKERLKKSNIQTAPRTLTQGGLVLTYGQHDTEHCTLDILLNKGFIESDQYDAGYNLRRLYYAFTTTGRWIEEGGKSYDGDLMTPKDMAEYKFNMALKSVDKNNRLITRCICVETTHVPADFEIILQIKHGLDDLLKYFKNNTCEEIENIV